MKPKAIVYTSKTGHTAAYAKLLSERTGLRAYTLEEARAQLPRRARVVYMGWIRMGKIAGYRKAERRFDVRAVCGVGMAAGAMNADRLRRATGVRADIDVYAIPGGFEPDKLGGALGALMRRVAARTAADLRKKSARTPAEENLLMLMTRGAAQIDPARLDRLAEWCKK